uniref:Uncharacterized protein n=1 Tax=Pithovirus LCPAC401 TaxID=2506595 RepID=A0A481Z9S5_9VIRU|nr:MAG: hypothetical protein LCPAC401_02860 [Pithovirus LCPAC401]
MEKEKDFNVTPCGGEYEKHQIYEETAWEIADLKPKCYEK